MALVIGLSLALPAEAAKNWPTTLGQVTESYIEVSPGSKGGTIYTPVVVYWYQVEGIDYSNDRVQSSTGGSSDYSAAVSIVERYQLGSTVEVHYDPSNPEDSMLEPGVDAITMVVLLVGGSFAAIGFGGAIWAWRSRTEVGVVRVGRYSPAPTYGEGVVWNEGADPTLAWGEKVLWQGRPVKGAFLLNEGRQSILGGILLTIFGLGILVLGAGVAFPLLIVGGAFFLIGAGSLAYHFWKKRRQFPEVEYTLTNRRILARTDKGTDAIDLGSIHQVLLSYTIMERLFKTGSLVFTDTQGVDLACVREPEEVRRRMVEAVQDARRQGVAERAYTD